MSQTATELALDALASAICQIDLALRSGETPPEQRPVLVTRKADYRRAYATLSREQAALEALEALGV